jgi:hypothetical protein
MAVDSRNDTGLSNCRTGWNLKVGPPKKRPPSTPYAASRLSAAGAAQASLTGHYPSRALSGRHAALHHVAADAALA